MLEPNKKYIAVVAGGTTDTRHAGAVKIKILGIMDHMPEELLPWALPLFSAQQQVPEKGDHLVVEFEDGDVNRPRYLFQSSNGKGHLPKEFLSEYPNLSYANLGENGFYRTHNKKEQQTFIYHPSDMVTEINSFGRIKAESSKAYEHAGYGAVDGAGGNALPVLTEGTVDVFCCTPVGFNATTGGHQGSEYLHVSHVSKATVEKNMTAPPGGKEEDPVTVEVNKGHKENIFMSADGRQELGRIDYMPAKRSMSMGLFGIIKSKAKPAIVFDYSKKVPFNKVLESMLDEKNGTPTHYVVGVANIANENTEEGQNENQNENLELYGCVQLLDLNRKSYLGADSTGYITNSSTTLLRVITVKVLAASEAEMNMFQRSRVNMIIENAKHVFNCSELQKYRYIGKENIVIPMGLV